MSRLILNLLAATTIGVGASLLLATPGQAQSKPGTKFDPVQHCCQTFNQSCSICCTNVAICNDNSGCSCNF